MDTQPEKNDSGMVEEPRRDYEPQVQMDSETFRHIMDKLEDNARRIAALEVELRLLKQ